MSNNVSKIKSIQPNGTWEGRNGLMYKFEVELESGDAGEVSAKTPDRWKVGDEVTFVTTPTAYGVRMALSKPGYTDRSSQPSNRDRADVQQRIDASW